VNGAHRRKIVHPFDNVRSDYRPSRAWKGRSAKIPVLTPCGCSKPPPPARAVLDAGCGWWLVELTERASPRSPVVTALPPPLRNNLHQAPALGAGGDGIGEGDVPRGAVHGGRAVDDHRLQERRGRGEPRPRRRGTRGVPPIREVLPDQERRPWEEEGVAGKACGGGGRTCRMRQVARRGPRG